MCSSHIQIKEEKNLTYVSWTVREGELSGGTWMELSGGTWMNSAMRTPRCSAPKHV